MIDELIRSGLHDALDAEPTPPYLRSRVIGSLPDGRPAARATTRRGSLAWTTGLVALVLTAALVSSLLLYRINRDVPVAPPIGVVSPEGIALGPDGELYISDFVAGRLLKLDQDGRLVVVPGGAHLHGPAGLAIDAQGDVYVAELTLDRVVRIDPSGAVTAVGSVTAFSYPLGLANDPRTGALYVGDSGNHRVARIDAAGVTATVQISGLTDRSYPGYMILDGLGDLYVSDRSPMPGWGTCRVIRLNIATGNAKVVAGNGTCGYAGDGGPATSAELDDPGGLALDQAGNLYVSDANNHRIRRIDRNGVITTVAGTGDAGLSGDGGPAAKAQIGYPYGIVVGPDGILYVADASCACSTAPAVPGAVRAIRLSDGLIWTVAGT